MAQTLTKSSPTYQMCPSSFKPSSNKSKTLKPVVKIKKDMCEPMKWKQQKNKTAERK